MAWNITGLYAESQNFQKALSTRAKRNKGGIHRLSDEWVRIQIGKIAYTRTYGKTGGLSFSHESRRGDLRVYTYGIKSPKADSLVP